MAPSFRHGKGRAPRGGSGGAEPRADRRVSGGRGAERGGWGAWGARVDGAACLQARKPLVEKKRRARINESLRELRRLLAGGEVRSGAGGRAAGAEADADAGADGRGASRGGSRRSWRTRRCWS